MKQFNVGDSIIRYITSEKIPMELKITEITEDKIICDDWKFDRKTGAEIDEELGWNEYFSGSYMEID